MPHGAARAIRGGFSIPGFAAHAFPIFAPVAVIAYYLVRKYVVGFLNRLLGVG